MTNDKKLHKHLKSSVARLMAVQALYSISQNKESVKIVLNEYLSRYSGMEVEGEQLAPPDKALLSKILQGVEDRFNDLQDMVLKASLNGDKAQDDKIAKPLEPLLNAILLCGAYELLAHHDVDVPIILNDYLDITHSFYSKNEVGLVNGVLDQLHKVLRGS